MDGPLYLDGRLEEPLEAFFQLMVIYTHLEDHIEEPLEMLSSTTTPSVPKKKSQLQTWFSHGYIRIPLSKNRCQKVRLYLDVSYNKYCLDRSVFGQIFDVQKQIVLA